jgi:hypothetical protein
MVDVENLNIVTRGGAKKKRRAIRIRHRGSEESVDAARGQISKWVADSSRGQVPVT